MNQIQVLALLAIVSMSLPAALAFVFWRERNYYIDELYDADQQYYAMLRDRNYYRDLALNLTGDSDWDKGFDAAVNTIYNSDDQVIWGSDYV
jgi:hypothetical protein